VHIGGAPLESGHHFESQAIQRIQNVFGRTLKEGYLSSGRRYAVSGIPFSKLSCIASPVRHVVVSCARRLLSRGGSLRWPVLDLVLQISQNLRMPVLSRRAARRRVWHA